jgi:hypothetical protein
MTDQRRLPESRGKFRRDIFEKVSAMIGHISPGGSPYRAVGEVRVASRSKAPTEAERELRAALDIEVQAGGAN